MDLSPFCFRSYDDRGRELGRVLNWSAESPPESWEELTCDDWGALTCDDWGTLECNVSDDTNIALNTTYTADGQVATVTAVNTATGDQTTTYTYGTTLSDSDIASNLLLRQVTYPDSVSDSDIVQYAYNRQGQVKAFADQNGTVHSYNFDLLGRRTQDRVTSVGTGIDTAVRRIETTYGLRGLPLHITSYDNAAVGSGSVVNDLQRSYNDFVQLETEYQEHGGTVNTSTSLKVQYGYASGGANTIRPTQMTYPDGRQLNFNYGSGSSTPDALSRITALVDDDGTTHLADYSYLGLEGIIRVENPEPGMEYTLIGDHGGADDPDTGDIYWGLDRFGRVKDLCWDIPSTPPTYLERVQHGYDRAGNRLWRKNPVAEAASAQFDELYKYDGIYRLGSFQRGTLNTGETGLDSQTFDECWTLDATGNWSSFRQDDTGDGTWDLIQARTASKVNTITGLTNSTGPVWTTPEYDAAGNMTTMPQPVAPTAEYIATYDAWNRLVKLTDGTDTVVTYAYDGVCRRIVKNSNFSGSTPTDIRHVYYSKLWQAIEERTGTPASMDRQFVFGLRYIDDLILRDGAIGGIDRLYALQDPNWNVTAVVSDMGMVQERYAYESFGTPQFLTSSFGAASGSTVDWETLFAGYRWESVSGLYGVRFRDFNPLLARWIERDPLGITVPPIVPPTSGAMPAGKAIQTGPSLGARPAIAAWIELYSYTSNSPIDLTDPSGLDPNKTTCIFVLRSESPIDKYPSPNMEKFSKYWDPAADELSAALYRDKTSIAVHTYYDVLEQDFIFNMVAKHGCCDVRFIGHQGGTGNGGGMSTEKPLIPFINKSEYTPVLPSVTLGPAPTLEERLKHWFNHLKCKRPTIYLYGCFVDEGGPTRRKIANDTGAVVYGAALGGPEEHFVLGPNFRSVSFYSLDPKKKKDQFSHPICEGTVPLLEYKPVPELKPAPRSRWNR